jgi:hypothetical protein
MIVSSVFSLSGTIQETSAAIASSTVVVGARLGKLPLVPCIAIGCLVFGILVGA